MSRKRSSWRLLRPRLRARASLSEQLRIERVISTARLLLAGIALIQVTIDPISPLSYAPIARLLVVFFVAHSISALLVLRFRQRTSRGFALTTSIVDLLAAAVTLPMAAPTNSFFAFFLFVLASAAFRWGFRETIAITLGSIALVLIHANLIGRPLVPALGNFEFDRVLGRVAYLAMMGLLLGYVAEEGRLLRAESGALATLLGKIRVDAGIARAVSAVAREVVSLFNASHLLMVVEERSTHRVFRWDTVGGWSVGPPLAPSSAGEPDKNRLTYFFSPPTMSIGVLRHRWPWSLGALHTILAFDRDGRAVDSTSLTVPAAFAAAHPFRRLLDVPMAFGDEWSGRVFVFDPTLEVRLSALTQFLQTIIRNVGPALFGVHLMGQLQARAGAMERARVARELHDGVIQSLVGVEMQLEVLKTQEPLRGTPASQEVSRLQHLVRNEVVNLRELMQQMRPIEFDPDELLDYLADMVQRFGRDTGISAQFLSELKDVQLPWRVCFELVRIVQEGLVNVRKHSAATRVIVRFGAHDGHWTLEISDNGRGFPFEGRVSHNDLETSRRGPTILKERVKAIGGHLAIDSTPGHGTRLEVLVPQEVHD